MSMTLRSSMFGARVQKGGPTEIGPYVLWIAWRALRVTDALRTVSLVCSLPALVLRRRLPRNRTF
jgi:hypothetical protein